MQRIQRLFTDNQYIKLFVLLLIVSTAAAVIKAPRAYAAYDGSRLIDNNVFLDANSMNSAQIQQFLVDKGAGLASMSFPLTCGAPSDTATMNAYAAVSAPCGQTVPASTIIYYAAQIYGLSPRVILSTMQKEQSLTTAVNPADWQINQAMGYGCPDSGNCSSTSNFFYQIDNGTWALRYHFERANRNNSWWNNGSNVCGGSSIYRSTGLYAGATVTFKDDNGTSYATYTLANAATASFYCYTPHAYNNPQGLYGLPVMGTTGLYYSGSYNFVSWFERWFGSTILKYYGFVSAINPPTTMEYGQLAVAEVKVRNHMGETWYSDGNVPLGGHPFRLMMRGYQNSAFADTSDPAWLGTSNQIKMVETSVAPGAIATFRFSIRAPQISLNNSELNMVLVKDGVQVYDDLGLQFRVSSIPDYAYQVSAVDSPAGLLPGDAYYATYKLLNTGTRTWYNDSNVSATNPHPIRLATPYYIDSPFAYPITDPAWLGTKNQIKLLEPQVAPGQTGTFKAMLIAPYRRIDNYTHNFELVLDGVKFIAGKRIPAAISVDTPNINYLFVDAVNPPRIMRVGESATATVRIRNNGNTIWRNFNNKILTSNSIGIELGDLRLIMNAPVYRNTLFAAGYPEWLGTKNQVKLVEPVVGPGQIATFNITWQAPPITGNYTEYFLFGIDGYAIMKDLGLAYTVTVTP